MRLLELLFRPLAGGPLSFAWRFLSFVVLALAGCWASHEYALSRALAVSRWTEPRRVVLRSAAGLKLGSRVLLDGIEVGRVVVVPTVRRDVGGAMVRFNVAASTDLRAADEASVAAGLGTISDAVLAIQTAGPANAKPWRAADAHRGQPALTVDVLARRVDTALLDLEGFSRTAIRELNANRAAVSQAVTNIATLAGELAAITEEDRFEVHRTVAALASIAAKADASRIIESVDLLTDQLARSLPAITRDTSAILATGAQLATTAGAVLAQVSRARKAAGRLRIGATSTTLIEAHGRRLESDLRGTVDVGATRYSLGWESGIRGGFDALVRRSFDGGWSFETGTLRGAPAIGLGAFDSHLTAEAFRVPATELRLTGTVPITDRWAVIGRLDDVTRSERRELLLGAEARW